MVYLELKEKREKEKKSRALWRRSAPSVETLEEPETPTSQDIIASTQARFKINDLLNVAPDTGKRKFRSQTTLRWGIVIEDPVWAEGKWIYLIRLKSEGREKTVKFEEDMLSFKVKEQDPDHMVGSFYIYIHYSVSNIYLRFRFLEVNRWRDWKKKLMRGRENVRHSERKVRSRLTTIKS